MLKILRVGALLLSTLGTNTFAQAEDTQGCVPPSIEVDKRYRFGIQNRTVLAKVMTIPESGCWIEIKEIFTTESPDIPVSPELKEKYWINLLDLSFVKKKN